MKKLIAFSIIVMIIFTLYSQIVFIGPPRNLTATQPDFQPQYCQLEAPNLGVICNPNSDTVSVSNISNIVLSYNLSLPNNNIDTNTFVVYLVAVEKSTNCHQNLIIGFRAFPRHSESGNDLLVPCSVIVVVTWEISSAPVFDNVEDQSKIDLGINPNYIPTAADASTNVFAHNECGSVSVTGIQPDADVINNGYHFRTIVYTASSTCGLTNVANVKYVWQTF
jgi:hypothetical protein